tara:strand:+ start:41 stop:298 length:258 start_codon:yes stop_codon:yes gene_type:complete
MKKLTLSSLLALGALGCQGQPTSYTTKQLCETIQGTTIKTLGDIPDCEQPNNQNTYTCTPQIQLASTRGFGNLYTIINCTKNKNN